MMNHNVTERIMQVHRAQGPERFHPEAARLLIREQGLESPERLSILIDKNINDIYNVDRKPSGKNVDRTPNREQQVSVIAQEKLKLAGFLFHHWQRCIFDWVAMGVGEDALHLLAG